MGVQGGWDHGDSDGLSGLPELPQINYACCFL